MDANKLAELRRLGYRIQPVCVLCRHGSFPNNLSWGLCTNNAYDHLKHSDSRRNLSVHRCGWCPKFELHPPVLLELGKYTEFLRGEEV